MLFKHFDVHLCRHAMIPTSGFSTIAAFWNSNFQLSRPSKIVILEHCPAYVNFCKRGDERSRLAHEYMVNKKNVVLHKAAPVPLGEITVCWIFQVYWMISRGRAIITLLWSVTQWLSIGLGWSHGNDTTTRSRNFSAMAEFNPKV